MNFIQIYINRKKLNSKYLTETCFDSTKIIPKKLISIKFIKNKMSTMPLKIARKLHLQYLTNREQL